jgi:hypothetical protein
MPDPATRIEALLLPASLAVAALEEVSGGGLDGARCQLRTVVEA